MTMTRTEYTKARKMLDAYREAAMTYCTQHNTNGIPQDVCATFPYAGRVDNAMRSSVEIYEFCADPPDKYFLYVNLDTKMVTTWTGDTLGRITETGYKFQSNMGDFRRYLWIEAINGKRYYGVFYESAGDYARIKAFTV